jgi:hypothetical protein
LGALRIIVRQAQDERVLVEINPLQGPNSTPGAFAPSLSKANSSKHGS